MKAVTDIPTPTHSLSLQQQHAWETNVLLSGAFSRGRPKLCRATIAAIGGLSRSPALIFIRVLSLFSLEVNCGATHFGGWPRIHWLMRTSAVWHLAPRHKKHDSICALYLRPPDHNNISGQFGFFSLQLVLSQTVFILREDWPLCYVVLHVR